MCVYVCVCSSVFVERGGGDQKRLRLGSGLTPLTDPSASVPFVRRQQRERGRLRVWSVLMCLVLFLVSAFLFFLFSHLVLKRLCGG